MSKGKCLKKLVFALAVLCAGLFFVPVSVYADSQLTADTEVYYANSKIYHLRGECGTLSTSSHMPLKDALSKGMKMCEACAKEAGLDSNKAKKLTTKDLPITVKMNLAAPAPSDSEDEDDDSEEVTSSNKNLFKASQENSDKIISKSTNKSANKSVDKDTTKSTTKATTKSKTKTTTNTNSDKVVSTKKADDENVDEDDDDEDIDEDDDEDIDEDDSTGVVKTATKTSAKTSTKSSTKSSAKSSTKSSKSSSNAKELMTESQRRSKFYSKTNPKRGAKPASPQREASAGFVYADFATFNSYASENGLGMTPIYLLGTIMQIEKVSDKGDKYGAVLMVNDCDGYQWYMRVDVAKDKYDLMKSEFIGKAANIYGYYTGYSGVTKRPMMDPTVIIEVNGNAVNLSVYK